MDASIKINGTFSYKAIFFYNQPILEFYTLSVFLLLYKLEEVLSVFLKCIVLWQLYTTSASPNSAGYNSKASYHS